MRKINTVQTINTTDLVKKQKNYKAKISEIDKKINDHYQNKHITTQEFNDITAENFPERLKQANLANKNDITGFIEKTDFDDKLKILISYFKQNL